MAERQEPAARAIMIAAVGAALGAAIVAIAGWAWSGGGDDEALFECPDGFMAPTEEECPDVEPELFACSDGSTAPTEQDCPDVEPELFACSDGSTAPTEQDCPVGDLPPTRQESGIRLSEGFSIDLDSSARDWGIRPASDDWGIGPAANQTEITFGLGSHPGVFYVINQSRTSPVEGAPTFAGCHANSLERVKAFWLEELAIGDSFCIETRQGGMAWIDVAGYGEDRSSILIDVYYWNASPPV